MALTGVEGEEERSAEMWWHNELKYPLHWAIASLDYGRFPRKPLLAGEKNKYDSRVVVNSLGRSNQLAVTSLADQ